MNHATPRDFAIVVRCRRLRLGGVVSESAGERWLRPAVEVALPASFEPLLVQIELIRPLQEKKMPIHRATGSNAFLKEDGPLGSTFNSEAEGRVPDDLRSAARQFAETLRRLVEQTAEFMSQFFGMPVQSLEARPLGDIPESARRMRNDEEQILSTWIMNDILKPQRPDDAVAVIGLVTCDLWPGDLNWVFGQASMIDQVGVWSLHRNGDPHASEAAYRLCLRRTLKTAVHETGHMLGIPHCSAYECC